MLAVISVPVAMWWFNAPDAYVAFGVIAMLFALYRHRGNIERLIHGTERRITDRERPQS